MTPGEIADRLEAEGLYQAAATIREQAEALKIATEALEMVDARLYVNDYGDWAMENGFDHDLLTQALARIKEVG